MLIQAAAIVLTTSCLAFAGPPIFTDLAYSEAKAASKSTGKIFIVDATAEWCGPCKMMDRDTWVADDVVAWIEANGIAAQIDVDHQRDLAQELGIRAMPTIIAFKNGEEADRVIGYKGPKDLITWLETVKSGRTTLDVLRDDIEAMHAAGEESIEMRLEYARALADAGKNKEAANEFVWLWSNMLDYEQGYYGVRLSFMVGDMQRVAQSEAGLRVFTALRDDTEARLKETPDWDDLRDWLELNGVIGDADATLAWIDRNIDTEEGRATLMRYADKVEPLLIEADRWADYGTLQVEPVRKIRAEHAQIAMMEKMYPENLNETQRAQMHERQIRKFRDSAATLHAALLAADRDEEAWDVATEAVELDDTDATRNALVSSALDARVAEARHKELVKDPTLKAKLTASLK